MKRILIFASGSGSNAQKIVEYFADSEEINVIKIFSNKKDAYVLERAKALNIDTVTFNKDNFYQTDNVLNILQDINPDLIVLAGFLWIVPKKIIAAFPNKIVNIHPSLLPKYGGKGMYGMHVHNAVIMNKERQSGITIHYVNEEYDRGDIIFQATCDIENSDTAECLANKIHTLEHIHYPQTIEKILSSTIRTYTGKK
jgi:phosphoribosylglycinamide formyltransferase-1